MWATSSQSASSSASSTVESGPKVAAKGAGQTLRVEGDLVGQSLVGQGEQQLLAGAQVGHGDVDAAVGQDPASQPYRPSAFDLAGQELATDGVADVMGQQ